MSTLHEVCPVDELSSGERKLVEVDGTSVGVFKVQDEFHALLNHCPHQYGPLCEGELERDTTAEVVGSQLHVEEKFTDDYNIICPCHNWSFDIETGEHTGDPSITVPTLETVVKDGTLFVEV